MPEEAEAMDVRHLRMIRIIDEGTRQDDGE
jgi:hypothetical protein